MREPMASVGRLLLAGAVLATTSFAQAQMTPAQSQGQIFKADIDGYDGRIYDLRGGVTWMFSRNFGAGVGYNRFLTTVETSKERFDGRVRLAYSGVQLYSGAGFSLGS